VDSCGFDFPHFQQFQSLAYTCGRVWTPEQNEFIWVRTYKDKAEIEAKNKEFQAAVVAAGVKLGGNVAKMEVREAESAFA